MDNFMKSKIILFLTLVSSGLCHAAIIFPKQAEEYRDIAYHEAIEFFRGSPPALPNNLKTDNLDIKAGYKNYWPDYSLGFTNKLLSKTLTSPSDWEYILMSGTNMIGVIGLRLDNSSHWSFGGMTFRGQPEPIWVGLQKAKELAQVKNRDYEFRYVSLSGADYPMIWLHRTDDDILIPLSNGYGKWQAYKPYSENEMVKLLRPAFENILTLRNTNAIPESK